MTPSRRASADYLRLDFSLKLSKVTKPLFADVGWCLYRWLPLRRGTGQANICRLYVLFLLSSAAMRKLQLLSPCIHRDHLIQPWIFD